MGKTNKKKNNIFENEFCKIFTQDRKIQKGVLEQLKNVSKIKNLISKPICMPDFHLGYGLPIGCVCAFEKKNTKIIPGAIGFDINCGVRLIKTNLLKKNIKGKVENILNEILEVIKISKQDKNHLTENEVKEIMSEGSKWCLKKGFAKEKDLKNTENYGCLKPNNFKSVSKKAIGKGRSEFSTIGNGNHFIEIGYINQLLNEKICKKFNIKKNEIIILIHTGSRGLGHEIAKNYIDKIKKNTKKKFVENLEQISIKNTIGKDYINAMNCASNFAFANRQIIQYKIEKCFKKNFKKIKFDLIYDLSHNILKEEIHKIKNEDKKIFVIRKGATSAFGKNSKNLNTEFKKIGQPIIIPGSCGTNSFLLLGMGKESSFSSCPHGAGRVMSRKEAVKKIKGEEVEKDLLEKGIIIKGFSEYKNIAQESPIVYKKINDVIKIIEEEKLAKKICNFKPLGVIKG